MLPPLAEARALVESLSVDSYTDMGQTGAAGRSRLAELEARLQAALGRAGSPAERDPPGTTARGAAVAFAQAFRLSALYPDTVGAAGDVIATLPVPTFSCMSPGRIVPARHARRFAGSASGSG